MLSCFLSFTKINTTCIINLNTKSKPKHFCKPHYVPQNMMPKRRNNRHKFTNPKYFSL